MSVQASGDIGGKIGVNLLSALTTELTAHLSRQVQQQIGETVTRRQTLKFNVDAGTAVVYVANWKRRVRTGEYLFLVDGQCVSVPYKVYYDLSCEIKSR